MDFKCQRLGCGGNHNTLMHRPTARIARDLRGGSNQRDDASPDGNNGTRVTTEQQLLQVSSGARDVTGNGIAVPRLYPWLKNGMWKLINLFGMYQSSFNIL